MQSGIDSDHFWELDFGELMVQVIANNRNRIDDMRMRAVMDHKQAEMMAFALNDPSKMPSVEEAYPLSKQRLVHRRILFLNGNGTSCF